MLGLVNQRDPPHGTGFLLEPARPFSLDLQNSGGNTHVHVAAKPQIVP
jgi:hypothetical protein